VPFALAVPHRRRGWRPAPSADRPWSP